MDEWMKNIEMNIKVFIKKIHRKMIWVYKCIKTGKKQIKRKIEKVDINR